MRSFLFVAVCGLAFAGPAAGQPAGKIDAPTGKRYALLVGVAKYGSESLKDLQFPEADVSDLAKVLKSDRYKRSEVIVLSSADAKDKPTAGRIRAALKDLLAKKLGAEDLVIIAFSGHGVQVGKEFYFCPVGADLQNTESLVSITELYEQLGTCKAGYKLLLADACRNDPGKGLDLFKKEDAVPLQKVPLPENTVAFFSGSVGERSFESPPLGHGLFFHFLIEGFMGKADLDGDNKVQTPELAQHVRVEMARHYRENPKAYPARQNPTFQANIPFEPVLTIGPWDVGLRPLERFLKLSGPSGCGGAYVLPTGDTMLVLGVHNGTRQGVSVWDLKQRKQVALWKWEFGTLLAASADRRGETVILAATDASRSIGALNIGRGIPPGGTITHPEHAIYSLAVSPKGDTLAIGDEKGNAVVYAARGGGRVQTFNHKALAHSLAFSPAGDQLVVGLASGDLFVYDVKTGGLKASMEGHGTATSLADVFFVRYLPEDRIVSCAPGKLIWWDAKTGKKLKELIPDSPVSSPGGLVVAVDFTPDGRRAILGWQWRHVTVWDFEDRPRQTATFKDMHPDNQPIRVSISADGKRAVSVTPDGTIRLYETADD